MMAGSDDAGARADAKFNKKQAQERDGAKARLAYEAEGEALRARTEKLRALRLAKEAAEEAAGVKSAPAKGATKGTAKKASGKGSGGKPAAGKKKSTKSTAKSAKLSDWLDGEGKDGRRG
jgi:hypothetical protein